MLLSAALAALLLAVTNGSVWGWTSPTTLGCFATALVVLGAWVPWERRIQEPLVDLRTTLRRPVLLTNLSSTLFSFAMYFNVLTTTQLLQLPRATGYGFGLNAEQAGLAMLPSALITAGLAPVSAAVTRRFGAKVTLLVGTLSMANAYLLRLLLTGGATEVVIGAGLVSVGTAVGLSAMPVLIMQWVPVTETAAANGLNTLVRNIGGSIASAAVAAVLAATTLRVGGQVLPALDAFRHSMLLASLFALLAAGVAAFLPRPR